MGQQAVGAAAAVVVITAVEGRSLGKYGARAPRYIAFEAGAAAQNLALQAVALGLGAVVIGGFDEAAVARELRLPVEASGVDTDRRALLTRAVERRTVRCA